MSTGGLLNTLDEKRCQKQVFSHFATLDQHPGEVGSCKKMLPLALLAPDYKKLALVYTHGNQAAHKALIFKENACLRYLNENGYPVVSVHDTPFLVEDKNTHARFGMVMDYIDGVFIEAKTLPPLKLLIFAALLGIKVPQQENWLAQNLLSLETSIKEKLNIPECLARLQENATVLGLAFQNLIAQFTARNEMIVDLQMIITQNGQIVIIDPLDIVDQKTLQCVLDDKSIVKEDKDLSTFLSQTKSWLEHARLFCKRIQEAKSPTSLLPFVTIRPVPLIFSQGDPANKSRINRIKSGDVKPRDTGKVLFSAKSLKH